MNTRKLRLGPSPTEKPKKNRQFHETSKSQRVLIVNSNGTERIKVVIETTENFNVNVVWVCQNFFVSICKQTTKTLLLDFAWLENKL